MAKLVSIDPIGCGCTNCLIGESRSLDRATYKQLRQLVKGKVRNDTYSTIPELKAILKRKLNDNAGVSDDDVRVAAGY